MSDQNKGPKDSSKQKDQGPPELLPFEEKKTAPQADKKAEEVKADTTKKEDAFSFSEKKDYLLGHAPALLEKMHLGFIWDVLNIPNNAFRLTNFSNVGGQSVTAGLSLAGVSVCGVILFFSVFKVFGGVGNFLAPYYPDLGPALGKLDQGLVGKTGFLIAMGSLFTTVLGAFASLAIMEKYLDDAWGKLTYQSLEQRLSAYWVILTIIPFPFACTIIFNKNFEIFYYLLDPPVAAVVGSKALHLVIAAFSFGFVYKIFSKGTMGWRSSFVGAVWAALSFEITKNLFFAITLWQVGSQPIAASAVITMFLMVGWLIFSAFSFIMGAKISYVYEHKDVFGHLETYYIHQHDEEFIETKELRPLREISLICLIELTKKFCQVPIDGKMEDVGIDPNELAKLTFVGPERAKDVMSHLNEVGLITILHDGVRELAILRFSPEKITLEEFLGRIERRLGKNLPEPLEYTANQWFWKQYSAGISEKFGHLTLHQLFEKGAEMDKEAALQGKFSPFPMQEKKKAA